MNKTSKIVIAAIAILALLLFADYYWWNYLIFKDKEKSPKIPVSGNGTGNGGGSGTMPMVSEMDAYENLADMPQDIAAANTRPLQVEQQMTTRPLLVDNNVDETAFADITMLASQEIDMQLQLTSKKKPAAAENNVVKANRLNSPVIAPTALDFDLDQYTDNLDIDSFAIVNTEHVLVASKNKSIPLPKANLLPSGATGTIEYIPTDSNELVITGNSFEFRTTATESVLMVRLVEDHSIFVNISVIDAAL